MSNKRKRTSIRKRKSKVTRLPARPAHLLPHNPEQKLSELIKGMALNHRTDVIFLAGLPDVPESRPHSRVSSR